MTGQPETVLYHYTCQHGRDGLGEDGRLLTLAQQNPGVGMPPAIQELSQLIWLTDLETPNRAALGLTSRLLRCDRIQYRYRVTDPSVARPWVDMRRSATPALVAELESAFGALPMHWWVATAPVRVQYAPMRGVR